MPNKIKYGVKNVFYAIAHIDETTGAATYDAPVRLPGAVNLSMEASGENTTFYADNIAYWVGNGNAGYSGTLELAVIPDDFRTAVLGDVVDDNNIIVEDLNASIAHFALLFQFEGDEKAVRHVMYNCTATRPAESGSTKTESIEPQTETINIAATSIYCASLDTDIVKARTSASTAKADYDDWFTEVYQPEKTATTT